MKLGAVVARTKGGAPIRRFRLRRFVRYAIYLLVLDDVPTVIAVEHASRQPQYWIRRVK